MNTAYETQQIELAAAETDEQESPTRIEELIEQIGTHYIADLRALNDEFARFYAAQLAAKDEQIAELHRRLEAAERERDIREAQMRELKSAGARYIAELQVLSEELNRRLDFAETEDNALGVGRGSP